MSKSASSLLILLLLPLSGCASDPAPKPPASRPAEISTIPSAVPAQSAVPEQSAVPARSVIRSRSAALLRMSRDIGEISGGWIIAARSEWIDRNRIDLARRADDSAERRPAVPADVGLSPTADLNGDGFVTLDEVIALRRARLDDAGIIGRLNATGFVFSLTVQQAKYLQDRGISQVVVRAIQTMRSPARPD